MILQCPACRGEMIAPENGSGQVFSCPHCQRPVPAPPSLSPRPLGGDPPARQDPMRAAWLVYAILGGLLSLVGFGMGLVPRDFPSQAAVTAPLACLCLVAGGYAVCRALDRAISRRP